MRANAVADPALAEPAKLTVPPLAVMLAPPARLFWVNWTLPPSCAFTLASPAELVSRNRVTAALPLETMVAVPPVLESANVVWAPALPPVKTVALLAVLLPLKVVAPVPWC